MFHSLLAQLAGRRCECEFPYILYIANFGKQTFACKNGVIIEKDVLCGMFVMMPDSSLGLVSLIAVIYAAG